MRSSIVLTLILGVSVSATRGDAQEPQNQTELVAHALARAIDKRLTVWRSPSGRTVHVAHCRSEGFECRERIAAFSLMIATASLEHGADPFLVAAIALRESGFNPLAEGSAGERGLVQLHPRGVGYHVEFVRNERHRERCASRPDACQGEIIDAGVRLLTQSITRCGSVAEGLGMYNTGRCQETGYSRRVINERRRLIGLAKEDQSPLVAALVD